MTKILKKDGKIDLDFRILQSSIYVKKSVKIFESLHGGSKKNDNLKKFVE